MRETGRSSEFRTLTYELSKDDLRSCRYIARPAVLEKRLSLVSNGKVRYQLNTPHRDGTTQVVFAPMGVSACDSSVRVNSAPEFECFLIPHGCDQIHRFRSTGTVASGLCIGFRTVFAEQLKEISHEGLWFEQRPGLDSL